MAERNWDSKGVELLIRLVLYKSIKKDVINNDYVFLFYINYSRELILS